MPKDLRGIYQYEETDDEATFSELLNLGMQSVSDALAYFAGESARREALDPAPPGAMWQDTDNGEKLWTTGPDGSWRQHQGLHTVPIAAWTSTTGGISYRLAEIDLPTVLGPGEYIALDVASGTNMALHANATNVVRHADRTTINAQLVRFVSSGTAEFPLLWRVVKAGA